MEFGSVVIGQQSIPSKSLFECTKHCFKNLSTQKKQSSNIIKSSFYAMNAFFLIWLL
jgi:hypothetical protein